MPTLDDLVADSDPIINEVYQKFRTLMPALSEDYREGLLDWRLVRTTTSGIPWDGYSSIGFNVDLTFSNGLEYHGRIRADGELE